MPASSLGSVRIRVKCWFKTKNMINIKTEPKIGDQDRGQARAKIKIYFMMKTARLS